MRLCGLLVATLCAGRVVFLIELCRHGARSPLFFQDWDSDGRWPDGPGQLTAAGVRQHYLLGTALRSRYPELFSRNFSHSLYSAVSTESGRTVLSAESQLLGLFAGTQSAHSDATAVPPLDEDFGNATQAVWQQYQPIPVFTVPRESDFVLRSRFPDCPKLKTLGEDVFSSKKAKELIKRYPELTSALQQTLNVDSETVTNNALDILDNLYCNHFAGKSLPGALTEDLIQMADKLLSELFSLPFSSTEETRLWASGFLQEVATHLNAFLNGTDPSVFRLYSAHDITLAGVLAALGHFNSRQPPFASSLLFELSEDQTLRVLYNGEALNFTECSGTVCGVSDFIALMKAWASSDLQKDCPSGESQQEQLETHLGHWLAWLLLSLLVMGLFAATAAVFASFVVSKRHMHLVEARDLGQSGR